MRQMHLIQRSLGISLSLLLLVMMLPLLVLMASMSSSAGGASVRVGEIELNVDISPVSEEALAPVETLRIDTDGAVFGSGLTPIAAPRDALSPIFESRYQNLPQMAQLLSQSSCLRIEISSQASQQRLREALDGLSLIGIDHVQLRLVEESP